jgi:hypothetical protein
VGKLKPVFAPHLGREVMLGGCKVDHLHVRHALAMRHILHAAATFTPPARTSFSANPALVTLLTQMFLNNELGDCVIAARARRIGLLTGNATGTPFIYSDAQLDTEYGRVGGYVVGDASTDNGCDPTVSADDGVKVGYADGSKDAGWVTVNAANQNETMLAVDVTNGACDLSMALPDAWVNDQMPTANGAVWDVAGAPDPNNGHNVAVVDYAPEGLVVVTWGLLVTVTWAAAAMYGVQTNGGMLIAHVNPDAIAKATAHAPDGFDWGTMVSYFDSDLGGTIPLVSPSPVTPPSSTAMTLAHAQALASAAIERGPVLQTRGGAAKLAAAGLATGWTT